MRFRAGRIVRRRVGIERRDLQIDVLQHVIDIARRAAQPRAMAIEDAGMLVRCLRELGPHRYEQAFKLYETNRSGRAAKVQKVSHENTWLRRDEDPSWCFGYDVFSVPLMQ